MNFSVAVAAITVSLFRSDSAAVSTSWKGEIAQTIYTPNCIDAKGVDTTTSLVALGNSTLCETDVSGGIEYHSKLIVSCALTEESEHPVVVSEYYLCADALCSNCSDTVSITWLSSIDDLVSLNPDTCFSWKTISDDLNETNVNASLTAVVSEDMYWKYASNSDVDVIASYMDVLIGNTCIADFEDDAEVSTSSTANANEEDDGQGHPDGSKTSSAGVWELSLFISAVARLTAAIFSV